MGLVTMEHVNQTLYVAIAFSDRSGAASCIQDIEQACAEGADLNGYFNTGETPLTSAILGGMGSPRAVETLLRLGADPGLRDQNGWTPWAACLSRIKDRVVADRMQAIQALLVNYGADQRDETILLLQEAVIQQDMDTVQKLLQAGIDPNAPIISPLACAVERSDQAMVRLLLDYHADPDGHGPETCLMTAASMGNLEMVMVLVEAGANISAYAWDDPTFTADQCALGQGHGGVAAWLQDRMLEAGHLPRGPIVADHPKFSPLYVMRTNGINYGLTTEDIVQTLTQWDEHYGIDISDIHHDRLVVTFTSLPDDLSQLANKIYEFCPDVIDQHFGCMDDLVDMMGDEALPAEMEAFLAGVDFTDENFGEVLLQKSLALTNMVALWWD